MNGIVINIDPVAFQIGYFAIRWYSIFVILAIIAAVVLIVREGKRKGISSEIIYSMIPWVLFGGFIGARLFHVIDRWQDYAGNPLQIFMLWQGGLAIWGALIGGGIAFLVYARIKHLRLGQLADILVPGLLVAQIIGRLACIVNGDAYGGVTDLPWGFIYVNPGAMIPANLYGVPTHPYPIYEMLWNGMVLFLILKYRNHFNKEGLLFLGYLALYSLGRFVLTFVRQENIWFWGLQEAQVVAAGIMLASLAGFVYLSFKERRSTTLKTTI